MVEMKALGRLEHAHLVIFLFLLGDHPHAEFTHVSIIHDDLLSWTSSQFQHHLIIWRSNHFYTFTVGSRSKARIHILL